MSEDKTQDSQTPNATPKPMNPKEIVRVAVKYYVEVNDNTIDIKKLRLEEITQDESTWHVTLSYPQQTEESIFGFSTDREYKEFLIDATSGEVKSMKIKKV